MATAPLPMATFSALASVTRKRGEEKTRTQEMELFENG